MNIRTTFFLLMALIGTSCAQDKGFDEMLKGYYENTVPLIKADSLQKILASNILILDAREKDEFNVSHIKGAKYAGYDHYDEACLQGVDKDQKIIVYCSIGYRSEKIGEKLKNQGFTNVYNLYGGVFDWVNKGNEVVDGKGNQTPKVHTYNKNWSKWLEKGEKVY